MKRLRLVLAVVALLGFSAGAVRAQQTPETPKPGKNRKRQRPKPKKPLLRGEYGIMTGICQLSEEQQKKIAAIVPQRDQELKGFHGKFKAVQAARIEARKDKDKEALKKASVEWRKLNAERAKVFKKWSQEILAALSPEQKAKWQQFTVMRDVKRRLPHVKFTDDQQDKFKAAYVEQTTGVDLSDAKARHAAVAKLSSYVLAKILTDEQRRTMVVQQIGRSYRKVKLTEEQVEKINAAYAEYTKGVDPADGKAWRSAVNKLRQHVGKEVLTDQQREAMKRKPPRPKLIRPAKPKVGIRKPVEGPAE